MKSQVYFADEKLKRRYSLLEESRNEDLHSWIKRAIDDLERNAFSGRQIAKRLIPVVYMRKYRIDNLWKYDMPKGWRLLYSVAKGEVCIISILLEWLTHKEYERRFKY
jgi:hypothetical protein